MAMEANASPEDTSDTSAAVKIGDKIHISESVADAVGHGEHFAGEVIGITGDVIRINGYVFAYVLSSGEFHREDQRSERILRLDNNMIFTVLPPECDMEALTHEREDGKVILTDHKFYTHIDTK